MGRSIQKLSATAVRRATNPGMYGDGGGLWLQVPGTQTKSWVFRFSQCGKAREMGLPKSSPSHHYGFACYTPLVQTYACVDHLDKPVRPAERLERRGSRRTGYRYD